MKLNNKATNIIHIISMTEDVKETKSWKYQEVILDVFLTLFVCALAVGIALLLGEANYICM